MKTIKSILELILYALGVGLIGALGLIASVIGIAIPFLLLSAAAWLVWKFIQLIFPL